jgi:hypothetical protein
MDANLAVIKWSAISPIASIEQIKAEFREKIAPCFEELNIIEVNVDYTGDGEGKGWVETPMAFGKHAHLSTQFASACTSEGRNLADWFEAATYRFLAAAIPGWEHDLGEGTVEFYADGRIVIDYDHHIWETKSEHHEL